MRKRTYDVEILPPSGLIITRKSDSVTLEVMSNAGFNDTGNRSQVVALKRISQLSQRPTVI